MFEEARQVTIPLHVLLQWDDEGNDRQAALDLFDAFGSKEKTLHANMGGHTGVPQFEGDDAAPVLRPAPEVRPVALEASARQVRLRMRAIKYACPLSAACAEGRPGVVSDVLLR